MMHREHRGGWLGIAIGLLIIAVGMVLLFDQTGMLGWRPELRVWPLFIIAMGLARFAQPRPDGRRDGGWLIFIGAWFLLNEMHVLHYRDSWPLFLVAIGIHTMWTAMMRPAPPSAPKAEK
jgi:hypothetical protein